MSDMKSSSLMSRSVYSIRVTFGTYAVCDDGTMSSSFLPVKMSIAVKLHFAWPCLPVFDVETLTTLHGRPLITMCAPLRICPASDGYVWAAPAAPVSMLKSSTLRPEPASPASSSDMIR
jgi:hypothetical protein